MKIDSSIAAVVTGGASGLGEATARALAAKGAKVALFDLNEERGRQVAAEIGGVLCKVDVSDERDVLVEMTLTAPGCPVAGEMPDWVRDAVMQVEGLKSCTVNLVFDPPWDQSMMSDEAKLQLNMF